MAKLSHDHICDNAAPFNAEMALAVARNGIELAVASLSENGKQRGAGIEYVNVFGGERSDKGSIFGLAKFGPGAEAAGTGQHHDERSLTAVFGLADKGLRYGSGHSERPRTVIGSVEISP